MPVDTNFYVGQVFEESYPPEAAIFCNSHNGIYIKKLTGFSNPVRWQIVEDTEYDYKKAFLIALDSAHSDAENNSFVVSSLGFRVDSSDRARRDIISLIEVFKDDELLKFCDHDNIMRDIKASDCKIILNEISQNIQYLYRQKWKYREIIEMSASENSIKDIEFNFKNLEFKGTENT